MATAEAPERKARKSVQFTDQKLVIDDDGSVSMVNSPIDDSKDTAVSHAPTPEGAADDGGLDMSLLKKKKKKPKKEEPEAEADADDADEGAAAGDDGGLDLSLKKKKKKKKAPEGEDAFAAKLAALDLKEGEEAEEGAAEVDEGDMDKGTGIWAHDESAPPIPFNLLLRRFYKQLEERNPDHASSGSRNYKIPPPQCLREGNKKTIFANLVEISKRMRRSDEHVTQYLFAELGTTGSTDGSRRLVIRGRFQQKQIENVLRKYIIEYVTCRTCRSPDTALEKGENRLSFITCQSCGSRRSVLAIKTGFSAQVGKRRKMRA